MFGVFGVLDSRFLGFLVAWFLGGVSVSWFLGWLVAGCQLFFCVFGRFVDWLVGWLLALLGTSLVV